MAVEGFLSDSEEQAVVEAITAAELKTSGEIRLHVENRCKGDAIERVKKVFSELGMYNTKDRNAVLIYIALLDHKLVVWGDEGIHTQVGQHFWDSEVAAILNAFKNKRFKEGLVDLILHIGEKLSSLFPHQKDDIDELDNSISKNDN
ncbi:TPM domain-containing protein [bacterium]|nr:MAG: TPM domain-containing protein [bacterium]